MTPLAAYDRRIQWCLKFRDILQVLVDNELDDFDDVGAAHVSWIWEGEHCTYEAKINLTRPEARPSIQFVIEANGIAAYHWAAEPDKLQDAIDRFKEKLDALD